MKTLTLAILTIFCLVVQLNAQTLNKELTNEDQETYLIGKIDKSGLETKHYAEWFVTNYNDYNVDIETLKTIKTKLKTYDVKVFMGTWCEDSQYEVSHFYKIIDTANYPVEQLTIIALDRNKESLEHDEANLNIVRVPTFILYKDGKEVNRIIETPVETLEKDLQAILTTNNYKPNYYDVKKETKKTKKGSP
ncbi:thioredoxin family protein [Winogradskyella sp.]|uniref:thioredoxin family protein n=1 Tax=Winogradskyella sp. TaxID=1883156 RepID=UPI00260D8E27|nr:thioredoxin family protein [Winogradskyella sp.]